MRKKRTMSAKRRKKNRSGAAGLLFLELIGVLAFAFLITTARGERQAAAGHNAAQPTAMNMTSNSTFGKNQLGNSSVQAESTGWSQHRPQFSEVMGNIWEAGF
jgi:hypothetical protein